MAPPARPPLPRLPLRAWLVLSHAAVLVLPLAALLGSGALADDLRNQTREDLEHQGALLAMHASALVEGARRADPAAGLAQVSERLSADLRQARSATLAGFRVTDPAGTVVATSGDTLGEELAGLSEVDRALSGEVGHELRPRPPPSQAQPLGAASRRSSVRVHVAVPIALDGEVIGAVVLSRTPREELQTFWRDLRSGVIAATATAALSAVGLGVAAAWVATRSLRLLEAGARRIAAGDFGGLEDLERPRRSHLGEVARTADALSAMTARLRERLAYIGEFAGHVSHEFKTPLATLKGTFELLEDDPGMERSQALRFLGNGAREVDRLERLVSGLLSLARADADRPGERVDLGALVAAGCERLGVPFAGACAVVAGDAAQLDSALANLVENGRRHGGPGATVRVEGWAEDEWTGFEVLDDGVGISPANQRWVFDRFFTTDREGGGTGLGLALVRAIVRRHGGEVTLQSEPGRTRFRVRLPKAGGD